MGGVAAIAREAGHTVTGSDQNVYPPMSDQLRSLGIELSQGYGVEQLGVSPDLWVIGNSISRGNALLEAILDSGQRFTSGPQWLSEQVLVEKKVLAIAGTHGKTTTTAMLAWILEYAGAKPGFLIGGVPGNFSSSARLGEGPSFVIEADEYDTAFFDKRSKFIHYRPRTLVLNNLEFDHADIFPDLASIETQFHHLVRTLPRSARIIANAQSEAIARVLGRGMWCECERFLDEAGWGLLDLEPDAAGTPVALEGRIQGRLELALAGAHNRANALAAIAAAHHVGISPGQAIEALAKFRGVRRRMETRGTVRGITVLDDFAHHPTAIASTIAALRERLAEPARILAVFEPRSNTMKLGTMRAQLADSLRGAHLSYCYSGGIGWDPTPDLASLGSSARVERDLDRLVERLVTDARPGDYILVMSNGGFGGIHERLLKALGDQP